MGRIIEHYYSLKECYPDCIMWMQDGDQIKAYGEDAVKTSTMLEVPLIGSVHGVDMITFFIGYLHYHIDQIPVGTKVVIVRSQQMQDVNNFKTVSQ